MPPRVLLVHGAATTSSVWDALRPLLGPLEVLAPDRPMTGDLEREVDFLAPLAAGALVVGVSGGATLGLALAASQVPLAGTVLHEPAVGSLVPGLLDEVAAAYEAGGVAGFARTLYGPGWRTEMAPPDPTAVARDLQMFRRFQPAPVAPGQGPVVTTVGEESPRRRHDAAAALSDRLGLEVRVLPGCRHFVQHDHPAALAAVVLAVASQVDRRSR